MKINEEFLIETEIIFLHKENNMPMYGIGMVGFSKFSQAGYNDPSTIDLNWI